jgi:ribosomal 50S subunit-associated protein YjgA (DUF615 family)
MAVDTESFHEAHSAISRQATALRELAQELPALTPSQREERRRKLVATLRGRVEPHTRLDERLLYPAVAERLGERLIGASMNYDHLAIRQWISEIGDADAADADRLQRLLYGLDALIRVHMWKEERLFLATLESSDWPPSAGA